MAFCKECGADLQGAKFCANCGAAAQDILIHQRESALAASATLRQASIAECTRMLQYFDQKTETWTKYDKVTELVENGRSGLHGFLLLASVIWLALGILVCCVGKVSISSGASVVLAYAVLVGFLVLVFLVPAALLMWGYIALNKRSKRKYEALLFLQDSLSAEIVSHYEAYGYCHVGIPYTRVEILKKILDNLNLGRCKTIDDSVNLMLDDEYKREMQQQAEAIRHAAVRAADAAEEAATAAKATLMLYYSDHF